MNRKRVLVSALLLSAACADDTTKASDDDGQTPDDDTVVEYAYSATVQPGDDLDECRFVKAPPEGMYINRASLELSTGNHHTVLYTTAYDEIPTVDNNGNPRDTSGTMSCQDFKHILDWQVTGFLIVAQDSASDDAFDLPDGVGLKVEPGAVLLYSVHTINTTDAPIEVSNKIKLHTIPEEDVEQTAGQFYFYNYFIDVPARSSASVREICPVSQDVTLVSMQSHTHRYGTGAVVNLVDADGAMVEELYRNEDTWNNAPAKSFGAGKQLAAGGGIDVRCDYMNTGDVEVAQGVRATDEMCALFGMYYPVDDAFANCNADGTFTSNSFRAMQIGDGAATCDETLACLQQARPFLEDFGRSMTPCFRDSCPAAARAIYDATACSASLAPGADPLVECEAELTACAQSTCE